VRHRNTKRWNLVSAIVELFLNERESLIRLELGTASSFHETCLWRIDTAAVKQSEPRNALQPRTQTPDDFIRSFCRGRPDARTTSGRRVGVEVGTAGHVCQSHIQDACRLTQAKGLARQIYHEPALEVRFVRKAMGTTSFLTRRLVGYATR